MCIREVEEVSKKDELFRIRRYNKLYIDEKPDAGDCDLEPVEAFLWKKTVKDKLDTHAGPYTSVQKSGNSCVVKTPGGVLIEEE